MSELYIQGGVPLRGRLTVQGAKNCVLPLLAACLLVPGPVELSNCPRLTDVDAALNILRRLGCRAEQEGHTIRVDASGASGTAIPEEQMRAMRSSIIFLGPLLARMGEARMSYPGGCELGPRPIDLHLAAIRTLGCAVEERGGGLVCTGRPAGGDIQLYANGARAADGQFIKKVGRLPQVAQQFDGNRGAELLQNGRGGSIGRMVAQAAQISQVSLHILHQGTQLGIVSRVQALEHIIIQHLKGVFQLIEGALKTTAQAAPQCQSQRFIVLQHSFSAPFHFLRFQFSYILQHTLDQLAVGQHRILRQTKACTQRAVHSGRLLLHRAGKPTDGCRDGTLIHRLVLSGQLIQDTDGQVPLISPGEQDHPL